MRCTDRWSGRSRPSRGYGSDALHVDDGEDILSGGTGHDTLMGGGG